MLRKRPIIPKLSKMTVVRVAGSEVAALGFGLEMERQ